LQYQSEIENIKSEMHNRLAEQTEKTNKADEIAALEIKARIHAEEQLANEKSRTAELNAKIAQTEENWLARYNMQKQEFENIISQLKAESAVKEKDFENSISQMQAENQKALAMQKEKAQQMIDALKAEMQTQAKMHECAMAQLKAESKEWMAKSKDEAEKAMSSLKSQLAEKISKLLADTHKAVFLEKAQSQAKEKSYMEAIETMQAEMKKKTQTYENEIAKIKAELGMKMLRMKIQDNAIAKEQIKIRQYEQEIERLKKVLTNLSGQIDDGKTAKYLNLEKFAKKIRGYTQNDKMQDLTEKTNSKISSTL